MAGFAYALAKGVDVPTSSSSAYVPPGESSEEPVSSSSEAPGESSEAPQESSASSDGGGAGSVTPPMPGAGSSSSSSASAIACPAFCTECDDDNLLFVTITGMAGTCYYSTPPEESPCSGWNGAVQLERANAGTCKWELVIANTHVVLECTDAQWLYSQTNPLGGYCVRFTATNTTGCPPLVGWTPDTDGSTCDVSAAELTLSWD